MRGIILAGGTGSRLWPLTRAVSKQLLPVFDKPMVHYPLATLMTAGLREVLVITTPHEGAAFERLLGDGSDLGMSISFAVQPKPNGIGQAFVVGREFLDGQSAALILGDNLFHGAGVGRQLEVLTHTDGAHVFGYPVSDPTAYGVVEVDGQGAVLSLEEKPAQPRSALAVPGLYFYAPDVVDIAANTPLSARGELEITDINLEYLRQGRLEVTVLPRGTVWLDTGTFGDLQAAGEYVRVVEERQSLKIACLEEIAWRNGWIDDAQLERLAQPLLASGYGRYLLGLI